MQSITFDINYDRINISSIFDEINEICKKSVLFKQIKLSIFNIKIKRAVNKTIKYNNLLVQNIYDCNFQKLKKFEENINKLLQALQEQAKICKTCDYDRCKEIFFNNFYNPITNSSEETLKVINNSYHFEASQIFESEEEYRENNKALKVFADIWNYESSKEDEELAFNHNAEIYKG